MGVGPVGAKMSGSDSFKKVYSLAKSRLFLTFTIICNVWKDTSNAIFTTETVKLSNKLFQKGYNFEKLWFTAPSSLMIIMLQTFTILRREHCKNSDSLKNYHSKIIHTIRRSGKKVMAVNKTSEAKGTYSEQERLWHWLMRLFTESNVTTSLSSVSTGSQTVKQCIKSGMGTYLLSPVAWIVEYRWRAANLINFVVKFYLCLPKESKEKKLCQGARSLDSLSTCLLVMEFRFDAMLCSNLGNENSDACHIKCSRGKQVARSSIKMGVKHTACGPKAICSRVFYVSVDHSEKCKNHEQN